MASKTSWHRFGTKLRHCHPVYRRLRRILCEHHQRLVKARHDDAVCLMGVVELPATPLPLLLLLLLRMVMWMLLVLIDCTAGLND